MNNEPNKIIWKETEFDSDYLISNTALVFSKKSNKYLKYFSIKGYHAIRVPYNGKKKNYLVHRLVAIAFIPRVEGKNIINHKDCNIINNCLDNLEWVTHKENTAHAMQKGLLIFRSGENHGRSKLKQQDVEKIIELKNKGEKRNSIANKFNITTTHVDRICSGRTWKSLGVIPSVREIINN